MKKLLILFAIVFLAPGIWSFAPAPVYNSAYVKALYARYPAKKSNFCPACKIWVNPFYTSIADTVRHMPLVEYELFTKANAVIAEKLNIPRSEPKKGEPLPVGQMAYQSAFSEWNALPGQADEDKVYAAANKLVKAKNPKDEIAKGHVQAWILNSFAIDAVILSDTYTFNAAAEDQFQNVGTEIATENYTRQLLKQYDVQVWGGTFGCQGTFTDGKITNTYPAYYWKIIKCNGATTCYWMPNLITETQAMLPKRVVSYQQLVANLGFDPEKVLN